MSLLTFYHLSQSYGAVDIFSGLSANMPHQARIGLVGANGIGKTTLLRILAGLEKPTGGQVHLARGTRLGYLRQEAEQAFAAAQNTVYTEMLTVFPELRQQQAQLRQMEADMGQGELTPSLLEAYGVLLESFEQAGGYDYELRIQQVLTGLGFAEADWHLPLEHCSGGQKTRVLLARLLLEEPDLLILDEPTNHLDVVAVEWLENRLRTWKGAMLVVSHDRYFLDKVVNTIWEMSRNGLEEYRGGYTAYMGQREDRWALRETEFVTVKERFLKDLDFVKRNIARASTSDRAKGLLERLIREVKAVENAGTQALNISWSRFSAEMGVSGTNWSVAEVEGHIKALASPNPHRTPLVMRLQPGHRSGRMVLRSKNLVVGYPDKPLFQADDIELTRQTRVALIGPNGSGKSTFLRTVMGELEPLAGRLWHGASLRIRYFAQAHQTLDPTRSVLDELLSQRHMLVSEARHHLARYLFRGDDVFKPVGSLSGGERGRLALALLALDTANFLLLDEPTNHLDIHAQEVLQTALQAYQGTVLLVSHDRYLIDRLATQIWELRDGRLRVHEGSYQSFLAAREREAVTSSLSPLPPTVARNGVVRTAAVSVTEIEARIADLEATLFRLGQQMEVVTTNQQWAEITALNQQYGAAEAELARLMVHWEKSAAV
ncbi:MAG: ABC-F family ATP-binding cassette domain-containing protein [Anaerolineales bacterium]|nr:ABC-F family ATP-binding cassette domain-containing protein [Anaerolineales bacterium]MCB8954443.1 ABC-F family ATP-binding cassette domain-containing protein [Ardenticatenales bacterium]